MTGEKRTDSVRPKKKIFDRPTKGQSKDPSPYIKNGSQKYPNGL